jgi:zinc protease
MKKINLAIVLTFLSMALQAQVDRTKAPKPSAAREIKIGEYQSFTLKNGLQVFVVENHKLPRVQFTLELKNDPLLEGDKAGYVSIAGDLLGTGTKTKTKAQLDEEVDFIGASLNTSSGGIFASSLTKHTARLLELMTDVLYNPAFSQDELDKLKTQTLSGITAGKDNPNAIAANVRGALVYGKGHPYGEITTEKSVGSITLNDCKNYFNTYFKPGNAYLVIVGDVDFKTAKVLAEKYFIKWTVGEVKTQTFVKPTEPIKTFVGLVDRPTSVQSVINISYPVELKSGSMDAIKARVTNQILGGGFSARLNQNLREKHGYTYGSNSQLSADHLIGNFNASASVRNEVTDSSVFELLNELKRISLEPVTEKELSDAKASISGAFGRSLESPQTIANFAVNTAKYNLPKDYYNNYLKSIDAVTIADVQATAKKFIKPDNAYIVVVGKGSEVADKLKRFGEIRYYDIEGNNYVPSKTTPLPAGLTAEKVIANYIESIGGIKKLTEVKSIKTSYKANAMGMEVNMTVTKKTGNRSVLEISGNGMTFQKVVCNGKDVSITAMGQKPPVDANLKEKTIYESAIIPELVPGASKATLIGIESVEGAEAYAIELVHPSGAKCTLYYDRKTGLKTQELESMEGPQGNVTSTTKYLDYKEVNGIMIPQTVSQNQGPMSFKFEMIKVEINPLVEDSLFKLD